MIEYEIIVHKFPMAEPQGCQQLTTMLRTINRTMKPVMAAMSATITKSATTLSCPDVSNSNRRTLQRHDTCQ